MSPRGTGWFERAARVALRLVASSGLALLSLAPGGRALASEPTAPAPGVVARGWERLDAGDYAGALLVLTGALPEGATDPALQSALARTHSEIGDDAPAGSATREQHYRTALQHARRGLALAPRSGQAHLDVAITTAKVVDVSSARDKVKLAPVVRDEAARALELDPTLWVAYTVLGIWHREIATSAGLTRLGAALLGGLPDASLDEAIAHLETARRLAPASIGNRLELARAYRAAGRKADARAELETALGLPPREVRDPARLRDVRRELAALGS